METHDGKKIISETRYRNLVYAARSSIYPAIPLLNQIEIISDEDYANALFLEKSGVRTGKEFK